MVVAEQEIRNSIQTQSVTIKVRQRKSTPTRQKAREKKIGNMPVRESNKQPITFHTSIILYLLIFTWKFNVFFSSLTLLKLFPRVYFKKCKNPSPTLCKIISLRHVFTPFKPKKFRVLKKRNLHCPVIILYSLASPFDETFIYHADLNFFVCFFVCWGVFCLFVFVLFFVFVCLLVCLFVCLFVFSFFRFWPRLMVQDQLLLDHMVQDH